MKKNLTLLVIGGLWSASPWVLLAQEHVEEGGGGNALFSINPGLSVWTVLVFLALLFILWRYAWGPILGALEARELGIQQTLDDAAEQHSEAQKLLDEHRALLADSRRQGQQIIAEAKDAGEQVRKGIEEKARQEGQVMIERARSEILREREAAVDEIRRESVDLALAAAARLLNAKLDADSDRELVVGYLARLSDSNEGAQA